MSVQNGVFFGLVFKYFKSSSSSRTATLNLDVVIDSEIFHSYDNTTLYPMESNENSWGGIKANLNLYPDTPNREMFLENSNDIIIYDYPILFNTLNINFSYEANYSSGNVTLYLYVYYLTNN